MRGFHHMAALVLALGAAGCGNLENAPLRVGTVHGQLSESDAALGVVSVLGSPGVRGTVAPDGSFTLERVPAGAVELFIIASADKAARVSAVVPGGRRVELPLVAPRPAGFVDLRVKVPGRLRVASSHVSLDGTPLQRLQVDGKGQLRLGPLPEGCYLARISTPGFPVAAAEVCVGSGEKKEVRVELPLPGKDFVNRGCQVSGCEEGSVCAPSGLCVECHEDSHCGAGLFCRDQRCEGERPLCAPCAGPWQCGGGAQCQETPEGLPACVASCAEDKECAQGFTCQGGRCLPDAAQLEGCHAYRQVGTSCDTDARCLGQGLANGVCLGGSCTYRCASDRECPRDFKCKDSLVGRVCQPHD